MLMKNEIYEGVKYNSYRDLVDLFKTKYSKMIAFEYRLNPNDETTIKKTYLEFANDIISLAKSLLKLNSRRVAIISPNRYEWCVSYFAVEIAGLLVIPLDKSLPGNEIKGLLERSQADTIFYSSKYENDVKSCNTKICFDLIEKENFDIDEKSDTSISYLDLIKVGQTLGDNQLNKVILDPRSPSIMLFTSRNH